MQLFCGSFYIFFFFKIVLVNGNNEDFFYKGETVWPFLFALSIEEHLAAVSRSELNSTFENFL